MRGLSHFKVPDLKTCIEANLEVARLTSPDVQMAGIALNTSRLPSSEARRICRQTEDAFGLPCTDPYSMGVDNIIDGIGLCAEAWLLPATRSL